jgi:hypothetical protein
MDNVARIQDDLGEFRNSTLVWLSQQHQGWRGRGGEGGVEREGWRGEERRRINLSHTNVVEFNNIGRVVVWFFRRGDIVCSVRAGAWVPAGACGCVRWCVRWCVDVWTVV